MTDKAEPGLSPRGEATLAERRAREAAALRENLRRRKQQQRPSDAPAPDRLGETAPRSEPA